MVIWTSHRKDRFTPLSCPTRPILRFSNSGMACISSCTVASTLALLALCYCVSPRMRRVRSCGLAPERGLRTLATTWLQCSLKRLLLCWLYCFTAAVLPAAPAPAPAAPPTPTPTSCCFPAASTAVLLLFYCCLFCCFTILGQENGRACAGAAAARFS